MSTGTSSTVGIADSAASSSPGVRAVRRYSLLWTVCGLLLLLTALAYAYFTIFSQPLGVDEGYLMITVQSFLAGYPLYDVVFTQYGPVYYVYEWLLHRVLSVPLTHDATRWLCILHWLTAAALLGVAARMMTGSVVAGLFGFMLGVVHLTNLSREPGHPQELIAVLLATAAMAATRVREKSGGLIGLAAVTAALFFIKPNVGVFFGAALFLALRFHSQRAPANGVVWLLIAGCALLPFILMRRHVMHEWCRNFSLIASFAIIATALTARDAAAQQLALRRWVGAAAAFLLGSLVFAGVALLTGVSPAGLLNGLLLTPLKTPNIAILPFKVPSLAASLAGVSLVAAAAFYAFPRLRVAHSPLKLGFAVVSAFLLVGKPQAQVMYALPWVWLVALPPRTTTRQTALATSFPRVFLALAAAWQSLQAYPVAGTQLTIGSLLLVLAATVCIADVVVERCPQRVAVSAPLRVALAFALVCLFVFVWCKLPAVRERHAGLPQLDLPGARLVRTDAAMAARYRELANYLRANSDTFITIPGVNDFYFWTGKRPPTHLNPTSISLLSNQQQEQVRAALARADRPLVAILESIVDNQRTGGPLINAVRQEYVEVHRVLPFKIYAPKPHPR